MKAVCVTLIEETIKHFS